MKRGQILNSQSVRRPLLLLGSCRGSHEGAGGPGGAEGHERSLKSFLMTSQKIPQLTERSGEAVSEAMAPPSGRDRQDGRRSE